MDTKFAKAISAQSDANTDTKIEDLKSSNIAPCYARMTLRTAGVVLLESTKVLRVTEPSCPLTYFAPIAHVRNAILHSQPREHTHRSMGTIKLFSVGIGDKILKNAGWFLFNPTWEYWELRQHVAFFPDCFDEFSVEDPSASCPAGRRAFQYSTESKLGERPQFYLEDLLSCCKPS